jgi:hypothetical protein
LNCVTPHTRYLTALRWFAPKARLTSIPARTEMNTRTSN